ncbi:hypothetical protein [Streptomyces sp. NPDC059979]|uniref:hypothetical protein n=1 Tax=Streptomyces sp. NPDC059979 TaxID=3347021 RepID=UPI00369A8351
MTWEEVKQLPTDPAALKAVLARFFPEGPRSEQSPDPDADHLRTMRNLLQSAPLAPRRRAAVHEVLAQMPGLRLVGLVEDSQGRAGTAVEVDTRRSRVRMVIDPGKGGLPATTTHHLGGEHDGKIAKRTTTRSAGPARSVPPYREAPADSSPGAAAPVPLLP